MLYHYIDFLALLAAIYTAMFFDRILEKKIWTNDYFQSFQEAVRNKSFLGNSQLPEQIIDNNKQYSTILQDRLTKKSVYMFCIVALLMFFCGLEQDLTSQATFLDSIHIAVSITLLLSFVVNIFIGRLCSDSWIATIINLVAIILLFICLCFFPYQALNLSFFVWMIDGVVYLSLGYLILPIIGQILICWSYNLPYKDFVVYQIDRIHDEYERAIDCVKNGDHKKIPKTYKDIMDSHLYASQDKTVKDAYEDSKDEYSTILMTQITRECCKAGICKILFTLLLCKCFSKRTNKHSQSMLDPSLPTTIDRVVAKYGYEALYDEYIGQSQKINGENMTKFCRRKGIDKKEFMNYVNLKQNAHN